MPLYSGDAKPSIIELSYIRMRNTQDSMVQRTNDYLSKSYMPALRRAGAKQVGAFTYVIGEGNPSTVLATEYADASSWEGRQKLRDDKELLKAADAFYSGPLQYIREETVYFEGLSYHAEHGSSIGPEREQDAHVRTANLRIE